LSTPPSRLRIVHIDPKLIKDPPVRVTSVWDPNEYEVFKASLDADGQGQAIICVKEGETWWLADGKHRRDEALLKGWPKIAVAYKEGTLVDAMLRNLYMNRLRGRTKASEEVAVVKHLMDQEKLTFDEVQKRTGLSREILEQRIAIGKAAPEIQAALDSEQIPLGVAFHLSRLPKHEGQIRLLAALLAHIPPMTTDEIHGIVDESLRILAERESTPPPQKVEIPIPTYECYFCKQRWPEGEVLGRNVCLPCTGLARDYIQDLLKKRTTAKTPERILAEQAAGPAPTTDSPS